MKGHVIGIDLGTYPGQNEREHENKQKQNNYDRDLIWSLQVPPTLLLL